MNKEYIQRNDADDNPVVHARWEYDGTGKDGNVFVCTHCLSAFNTSEAIMWFNYCPECGARMDGDNNA